MKVNIHRPSPFPKCLTRKCLLVILVIASVVGVSLFLLHIRLRKVLYTVDGLPTSEPLENVPSAEVERETVGKLYHAVSVLHTILNRTGRTWSSFYRVSSVLESYRSRSKYQFQDLKKLPYKVYNHHEFDEMLKASHVLMTHAQEHGLEKTRIDRLYHQLGIIHQREFPKEARRDKCDRCMEYHFRNIIKPHNACGGEGPIAFVSLITSVPRNILERQAIRETWGKYSKGNTGIIRNVFLFGGNWSAQENAILQGEDSHYGDILQDDFIDNYYNLTYKILMGYHWAVDSCKRARFVMRAADDTYIYVKRVLDLITDHGHEDSMVRHQVGLCFKEFRPHRLLDYKGYLSRLEYSRDIMPPYALGTNFLTSMELTKEIIKVSPNVPFISIEDAYIGLVLSRLRRGCYHIPTFVGHYSKNSVRPLYLPHCNALFWYTHHTVTPSMMADIHKHCVFPDLWSHLLLYSAMLTVIILIVFFLKGRAR